MRILLTTTTLLLQLTCVFAQTVTVEQIRAAYPEIFTAEISMRNDKASFSTDVNKVGEGHFLAGLVNEHKLYVDYLLQNYLALDWSYFKGFTKADEEKFRASFLQSLATDSVFNASFLEAVHHYLMAGGGGISDHRPHEKMEITIDSLAHIASRFFHASRFTPDGKTEYNICVGNNGYHNTSKADMTPLVEAFCFNVIFTNMRSEEYDMWGQLKENAMKIKEEPTDLEGDEKLELYRLRMYELMAGNEKLKKLLRESYEQQKAMLNFRLI
jgi:hypothetical protein